MTDSFSAFFLLGGGYCYNYVLGFYGGCNIFFPLYPFVLYVMYMFTVLGFVFLVLWSEGMTAICFRYSNGFYLIKCCFMEFLCGR